MLELSRDDLAQVLEIITAVNEAQDRNSFFRAVLVGVAGAVPCDVATINEVDPQNGRLNYWMYPETYAVPEGGPETFASLAHEHPLIRNYEATGDGCAHRISDMWTAEELHASRLYQQVYGPMGIEYQVAFILPAPRPTVLGIALSRGTEDFSDRDLAMLDALRPHLVQAWLSAGDQERLRAMADAATSAATEHGWNVVVLSDPPQELGPGALESLQIVFGPRADDDVLPLRVRQWLREVSQAPGGGNIEIRRPLDSEEGDRRVVLRYLPPQRAHPGAIVVRQEPVPPLGGPSRHRLESLLLTAREAEIVHLVTLGEANASIARRLEISPGTVKKHLDNVYGKLGVRGRGALTAFVLDIA
jgi:DNA-binding CsgD family transcriptional regulator